MYECVAACECGSVCAWPSVRKFGACLFLGARLKTGTSQLYSLTSPLPPSSHTHMRAGVRVFATALTL